MSWLSAIPIVGDIYDTFFDDSEEDAAWAQKEANEQAIRVAERDKNLALTKIESDYGSGYQYLNNRNAALSDWLYRNYSDIVENMLPEDQAAIQDDFKQYFDESQATLNEAYAYANMDLERGYGDASRTTAGSMEKASDYLKDYFQEGQTEAEGVASPYTDTIMSQVDRLNSMGLPDYDNRAAYDERLRRSQEDLNQQLLSRGEYNSSEGLRQQQELSTALRTQQELDDYNRAVQKAELMQRQAGTVGGLVGAGVNAEGLRTARLNPYTQLGTQLADIEMSGGQNLANIYTGQGRNTANVYTDYGMTAAGAQQSMGQDWANLRTQQDADKYGLEKDRFLSHGTQHQQLTGDIMSNLSDRTNRYTGVMTDRFIPTATMDAGKSLYESSLTTANRNAADRDKLFSDLGTIYGSQTSKQS